MLTADSERLFPGLEWAGPAHPVKNNSWSAPDQEPTIAPPQLLPDPAVHP